MNSFNRLTTLALAAPAADPRPMLLRVVWSLCIAAAVCAVALALDTRVLDNGDTVWLKPLRFCVAFGLHIMTLWWLAGLTRRQELGDRWFALSARLQAAVAILELGCIALQAARGRHSHFNYATAFDQAIFTIMGMGTAVLLLGIVLMIAGLIRWPTERATNIATIGGLLLAVLGGLVGVWMVMPTPEQRALLATGVRLPWVGSALSAPPSGITMPWFGWDMRSGDWRVPHFIGLHAIQALPCLAWVHQRIGGRAGNVPLWMWAGMAAYAVAFFLSVYLTGTGSSVLRFR